MELRQLGAFVAVVEEGTFTAAAGRLLLVQSAVSASVQALEREVGAPLLTRGPRRVALTDAGAALLPHARAALDAARDAREAVDLVKGGLTGTVRVGTMPSVGLVDVPALLGAFHRSHPGVALRLSASTSGSAGLAAAVADRHLDLAFVSVPGGAAPGVRLLDLASAPMDLLVPPGHDLAERVGGRPVDLAELAGLDFIDSPAGYGNRAATDAAFAAAGLERRVTVEVADIGTVAGYVRHGLGVAVVPRFTAAAAPDLPALVLAAGPRWPLALAVPRDRRPSAATAALVRHVREHAAG